MAIEVFLLFIAALFPVINPPGSALVFLNYLQEMPYFVQEVLPRLERAGLRGAVTSVPGFATMRQRTMENGEFTVPRFPFPEELPQLIQQVAGVERLKFLIRGD